MQILITVFSVCSIAYGERNHSFVAQPNIIDICTMALHIAKTYRELITEAKELELAGQLEQAAKLYERAARAEPHEELPYDRLMIIYRKLYRYEDELKTIDKGIAAFEDYYKKRSARIIGKNKTAERLSKSLAKSLGLTDKKGKDVYHPAPVEKWMKRRKVVEKKLGK